MRDRIRPLPSLGFIPTPPEEQGSCTGCVPAPLAPSWNILPPAAAFSPFHTGADYPLTEVPGPRVKADLTADLTEFCPFKSPGEAPGSVFSPSLHISRASLHPPLPLPWQPPAQHPPCARLPKICPRAAPQGSGLASALQQEFVFIQPWGKGEIWRWSQRSLHARSLEMGHSWSSLGNGRAGKGGSQGDVLAPSRRGLCFSQGEGLATEVTSCQNAEEPFPGELGHLQCQGSPQ